MREAQVDSGATEIKSLCVCVQACSDMWHPTNNPEPCAYIEKSRGWCVCNGRRTCV